MGVSVTRKVLAVFLVLLPFVDTPVHTDAVMLRGGTVHSPEPLLDLFSVDVSGKENRVESSDVDGNGGR